MSPGGGRCGRGLSHETGDRVEVASGNGTAMRSLGVRTRVLPALMVVIGIALIVRTLVAGGGALAIGIVFGVLFLAAGAGRLYLEAKR
jgi:hypothetical protein